MQAVGVACELDSLTEGPLEADLMVTHFHARYYPDTDPLQTASTASGTSPATSPAGDTETPNCATMCSGCTT